MIMNFLYNENTYEIKNHHSAKDVGSLYTAISFLRAGEVFSKNWVLYWVLIILIITRRPSTKKVI